MSSIRDATMKQDAANLDEASEIEDATEPVLDEHGNYCSVPNQAYKKRLLTPDTSRVTDFDQVIWRYVKLERLIEILDREILGFPQVSRFHEPLEGSFSPPAQVIDFPEIAKIFGSQEKANKVQAVFNQSNISLSYFVSCWHMSDYESDMMWERYESDVAIRTTVRELARLQPIPFHVSVLGELLPVITLGPCHYVDHSVPGSVPPGESLFYKAREFEGDKEFRSILMPWSLGWSQRKHEKWPGIVYVPLKPSTFVKEIVVRTRKEEDRNRFQAIDELLQKRGLTIPVRPSTLEKAPRWNP